MPRSSKKQPSKNWAARKWAGYKTWLADYKERRPHRTFRRTRRRDYVRPIVLPGHIAFTHTVFQTVWRNWRLFLPLAAIYAVLYGLLVGLSSQATYADLSATMQELGAEAFGGDWDAASQVGALFLSVMTSGLGVELTEAQQLFAAFLTLMVWLTVVWLLRNKMAGHAVKLRDGLYSAGAPLFASIVVVLIMLVQLIPVAIAAIGYAAAVSTGMLDGGVEAMLFWIAASLLALLSLYWISSSLFAMVIITLPGMYPLKALKSSGDIVFGRRLKLLLRVLWMVLVIAVVWALVLLPFIGLDMWLKSLWPAIEWLPVIPILLVLLSALTTIWTSTYIYLLYRKVVDYVAK
tara:strand:+ start:16854 stop:17897 length:1044 start_codon:yes stop_codon:yes gene_type:complete